MKRSTYFFYVIEVKVQREKSSTDFDALKIPRKVTNKDTFLRNSPTDFIHGDHGHLFRVIKVVNKLLKS